MTANAVSRRFMAIKQVNWETVNMYVTYDNSGSETNITDSWPGTTMTHWKYDQSNGIDCWYIDLNIPDGVTTIKVVFNNGSSGGSNQTWDYNNLDISGGDKLFYIYDDDPNNTTNNHGISPVDLDYYISGWPENSDNSDFSKEKLNFNTDGTYSCDLDLTSYTARGYRCVFPFFAIHDNWVNWNFCIRPKYSTADFTFRNQENVDLDWNGTQCWKFNEKVKYNCKFNFVSNKWSVYPYFTRTIKGAESNGKYYATFSSDYDVAVPTGITAYYGDIKDESKVIMTSFGEGVGIASTDAAFLEVNSASDTYTFTPATSTRSGSNLLKKPTDGVTPAEAYVFANKSAGVGFYKTTTALNNQQGKAYLEIESGAPSFSIEIEGETTGIKVINFNEDNNLNNGQMFDLQGRRIADPTKGVYIVNGKKVIIK